MFLLFGAFFAQKAGGEAHLKSSSLFGGVLAVAKREKVCDVFNKLKIAALIQRLFVECVENVKFGAARLTLRK